MFRRTFFAISTIALTIVWADLAPAQTAPANEKFTFVAGSEGMHYLLPFLAKARKAFDEEGLELDWQIVNSGARQMAAVMGGSADMALLGLQQVIKAQAQGADVVAVVKALDTIAMDVVLSNAALQKAGITREMPPAERLKRLQGLRFGISSPGSTSDDVLRRIFVARGTDPDKAVTIQPLGAGASILAAFERGVIDGFVYPAPLPEIVESKRIGWTIIDQFKEELPETARIPYVMVSRGETVKQRPVVMEKAIRALTKTMVFIEKNPEEAAKLLRENFPEMDMALYGVVAKKYLGAAPRTPVVTRDLFDRALAWSNIGAERPLSQTYEKVTTMEIARKVAGELGLSR